MRRVVRLPLWLWFGCLSYTATGQVAPSPATPTVTGQFDLGDFTSASPATSFVADFRTVATLTGTLARMWQVPSSSVSVSVQASPRLQGTQPSASVTVSYIVICTGSLTTDKVQGNILGTSLSLLAFNIAKDASSAAISVPASLMITSRTTPSATGSDPVAPSATATTTPSPGSQSQNSLAAQCWARSSTSDLAQSLQSNGLSGVYFGIILPILIVFPLWQLCKRKEITATEKAKLKCMGIFMLLLGLFVVPFIPLMGVNGSCTKYVKSLCSSCWRGSAYSIVYCSSSSSSSILNSMQESCTQFGRALVYATVGFAPVLLGLLTAILATVLLVKLSRATILPEPVEEMVIGQVQYPGTLANGVVLHGVVVQPHPGQGPGTAMYPAQCQVAAVYQGGAPAQSPTTFGLQATGYQGGSPFPAQYTSTQGPVQVANGALYPGMGLYPNQGPFSAAPQGHVQPQASAGQNLHAGQVNAQFQSFPGQPTTWVVAGNVATNPTLQVRQAW